MPDRARSATTGGAACVPGMWFVLPYQLALKRGWGAGSTACFAHFKRLGEYRRCLHHASQSGVIDDQSAKTNATMQPRLQHV